MCAVGASDAAVQQYSTKIYQAWRKMVSMETPLREGATSAQKMTLRNGGGKLECFVTARTVEGVVMNAAYAG